MKTLYSLVLLLALALSANAIEITKIDWAPNHSPSGGEFILTPNNGSPFNSFCIERNQYISPGSSYEYTVSNMADQGNDPISVGTAWLYSQFRAGTLTGYNSTFNNQIDLQNAFWFLEDEITLTDPWANPYLNLALTTLGRLGLTTDTGDYNVVVWNLKTAAGAPAQSQLALGERVPDGGGTLALASMGILGLLFYRKQ